MIACLGWGSLIWCQKALPVRGVWHQDGPDLPLEFARKSGDGRLTLVACDQGTTRPTLWAELDVPNVEAARLALALREGVPEKRRAEYIAWWSAQGSSSRPYSKKIAEWAAEREMASVVWTALPPKSPATKRNGDFPSREDVIGYLTRLKGGERDRAEEYIRLAPRQINTTYRTAIEEKLGWTKTGLI